MKTLYSEALKVVPNGALLINILSARIRQLNRGAKPVIETVNGFSLEIIALNELVQGKLKFSMKKEETGKKTGSKSK